MGEPPDLFASAEAALRDGDPSAAERLLRALLGRRPGHVAGWRSLGEILRRFGRLEEAAAAEREAARQEALPLLEAASGFLAQQRTDKAGPLLSRVLCLDPGNELAIKLAADAARLEGDYAQSLAHYRRLLALRPGSLLGQTGAALFAGEPPPVRPPSRAPARAPGQILPSSFLRWRDWLPAAQRDEVFGYALAHVPDMVEATVWQPDGYRSLAGVRRASVLYEPEPIVAWFVPLLREALPEVCRCLGLPVFETGRVELQLTFHGDGGFYERHRDTGWPEAPAEETDSRRISFVAYFARRPRRFSGGELILFDTDPESGQALLEGTLVEPEDNSVVFFPSVTLHEVRPIRLEGGDPADGRITLNGWIHDRFGRAPDYRC